MQMIFDKASGKLLRIMTNSLLPDGNPEEVKSNETSHVEKNTEILNKIIAAGSVRFVNGELLIYSKIETTADNDQVSVGQIVTVTATFPNVADTEVNFKIDDSSDIIEPVIGNRAEHSFAFSLPGVYTITVSSQNHGAASVEVTVHE